MRSTILAITAEVALLLATAAAHASGGVQVSFVQPDRFVDAEDARRDATDNLRRLKSYLEERGRRYVADGQTLIIEVLDVDLAGEVRFDRRRMDDVRVLRGMADWPRITLRYTLETAGQPARHAEQTVYDMAYLQRMNRYTSDEPLRYEKPMLDAWFDAQFGSVAAH
jgi:hypothetical protein